MWWCEGIPPTTFSEVAGGISLSGRHVGGEAGNRVNADVLRPIERGGGAPAGDGDDSDRVLVVVEQDRLLRGGLSAGVDDDPQAVLLRFGDDDARREAHGLGAVRELPKAAGRVGAKAPLIKAAVEGLESLRGDLQAV